MRWGRSAPAIAVEDLADLIRRSVIVTTQTQLRAQHPARLGAPAAGTQTHYRDRDGEEQQRRGGVGGDVERQEEPVREPCESRSERRCALPGRRVRARGSCVRSVIAA